MTVQASIMKHLESSLDRPSPATRSQKRQWRRWKSSADFSSFNSTSKASLHHSAVRSGASAQGWVGGGGGHHSRTLCRRFQLHHLEPLTRLQTGCTELDRDWRMENYISPPAALRSIESHFFPAMSKTWLPCTFIRP